VSLKNSSGVGGLPEWTSTSTTVYSVDTEQRLSVTSTANSGEWNWTLKILEKDLATLKAASSYGPGVSCFISVNTRDLASNDADGGAKHWRFSLDTGAPEITFPALDKPLNSDTVSITGSVNDDNKVKTIRFYLRKYNYVSGAFEYPNGSGGWTATAPSPLPWAVLNDNVTGSSQNWTLLGDLPQAASIYGNGNMFAGDKGQGRYELNIEASDWSLGSAAGNVVTAKEEFYVDRGDPNIVWADTAKTYYRTKTDGTIKLEFTASDPNYLWNPTDAGYPANAFAVSIKKPNGDIYTVNTAASPTGEVTYGARTLGNDIWSQLITLNPKVNSGSAWPSGRYTLTLTVTDRAGNAATSNITREITVDNDTPVIKIDEVMGTSTAIVNNAAITGRQEFRGNFTKTGGLSPIAFVAFYIAPNGANAPTTPALSPGDTWFANIDNELDLAANSASPR